jgi:hypothetical protein
MINKILKEIWEWFMFILIVVLIMGFVLLVCIIIAFLIRIAFIIAVFGGLAVALSFLK